MLGMDRSAYTAPRSEFRCASAPHEETDKKPTDALICDRAVSEGTASRRRVLLPPAIGEFGRLVLVDTVIDGWVLSFSPMHRYGLLATGDAADFVRKLSKQIDNESYEKEIWWEKWRGRTGLSQEAQIATAAEALSQTRALSSDDLAESLKGKPKAIRKPLGEKFDILFTNSDGERITVGAYEGETLMDCAKRADLVRRNLSGSFRSPSQTTTCANLSDLTILSDRLHGQQQVEATCGGFCECATCMMHLVPNGKGEAAPVPEVSEEEDDQLEYALFADDDSRLACQIEITPQLKDWLAEGGKIRLPRA